MFDPLLCAFTWFIIGEYLIDTEVILCTARKVTVLCSILILFSLDFIHSASAND
jgi:hypothetical protein